DLLNNCTVTVTYDVATKQSFSWFPYSSTLTVASGKTLSMNNASTLNQNAGTFTLNGTLTGNFTQNNGSFVFGSGALLSSVNYSRSEERRVGKEWICQLTLVQGTENEEEW